MRISTKQQFDLYLSHIQAAHSRYVAAQEQVLSGKKFSLASESPSNAHFVLSAGAIKARTQQLDKNLRSAKDYLGNTESVLSELNTMVNRAYGLSVNGANSSYDQASRDSMAQEVGEIQRRLVSLANTQGANGQFIFAGQKTDVKPFTESPPSVTFNGDTNPISVEVRPNETMRVNLQGADTFFSQMYDSLEALKNDLLSGDLSQISNSDIQAMQGQLRLIGSTRADVGTKLQTVSVLADQNQKRIDDLTLQVSDVQDVDLTEAITRMQTAETAYTAALQVTTVGQKLSLMDFMR
ncbi:MAG: flagellar hook-associated protein FlgL [Armatimonadetes bacterium]|nr:flagellar hook-associated protein FlgL [Armatimonadota bacterium]